MGCLRSLLYIWYLLHFPTTIRILSLFRCSTDLLGHSYVSCVAQLPASWCCVRC
jgi:hypothetical protein